MSGHSKWSTIKHRKGAQDAKRAQVFSRASKNIIIAAQSGGADPETNYSLKIAIDAARKVNMPKDNIARAIKAGAGGDGTARLEEAIYEAMGPEGSSFIIVCATDNTNRSLTEVKTALKKNGGKFVPSGSVSFNYEHVGLITLKPSDIEEAELEAIEAGAKDVKVESSDDGDVLIVQTSVNDFHTVQTNLTSKDFTLEEAKLSYEPTQTVELSVAGFTSFETLYDAIDELDDVQEIFTNVA